jgi:hypothetical protein
LPAQFAVKIGCTKLANETLVVVRQPAQVPDGPGV